ncbi:hypothetical protein SAMN05878443_2362 [Carnobacterium alterfunditum]|uniref:Lipoprotein n=1 Tax=Carnobacterium alterfunditum TaxID=28230 RepID=A0A1N6IIQ7_9LACT|nr:hypothetical protein SAMN05878443_2362 [Carnobacterium alterfunditum]
MNVKKYMLSFLIATSLLLGGCSPTADAIVLQDDTTEPVVFCKNFAHKRGCGCFLGLFKQLILNFVYTEEDLFHLMTF